MINGGISIEREEKELKEDTIEEVEMRIELVDMEQEELDKGNILQEVHIRKVVLKMMKRNQWEK